MKLLTIGINELPLQGTGWQVVACENLEQAVSLVENTPDLRAIIARKTTGWPPRSHLPVLLLGASHEEALEAGAAGVLSESPGPAELKLMLDRLVHHPSLNLVLDGLEDSFCLLDRDWRYLYVNRTARQMTGMKAEEMIGRSLLEIFPTLTGTDFAQHLQRGLKEGVPARFRRVSALNGSVFEHRIYPVSYGAALVSADVTEQARQEDEARQTERRLAAVFEQTEQFMAILDTDHNVLELNHAALRQAGLEAATVTGKPLWSTVWWEPYRIPLTERLEAAHRGESSHIEITFSSPDGSTRILDCQIAPVTGMSWGGVELVVIQGVDQTERRRGERHLRCLAEAGQTLGASLDYRETLGKVARLAVPEVADWASVYLVEDGELRVLAVAHIDPARVEFARLYQERYPTDLDSPTGPARVVRTGERELVENISEEMLEASARSPQHLADTRALGLLSYLCVPLVARGRTIGAISLITGDSGRHLGQEELKLAEQLASRAALAVDNARLFEASQNARLELQRARDEALQANRMKSAFLANMSHEIRTPMNGIRGMLEFLEEMPLPAEGRDYLSTIRQCADSLLHILNDVLDLSRIEAGKLEVQTTAFPLVANLTSTIALFRHAALEKGLEYQLELSPDLPKVVLGDPDRLRQIAVNLLSNAVKFTEHGFVKGRATYQDGHLVLRVRDSGPGVEPSLRARLFEPFSQGDESSTRRFGGTGLGLSIVKRLVELMGGSVTYAPPSEGGSLFQVRIPMPLANELPPVAAGPGAPAAVIAPGLEVLVVEDNPVNRQVLSLQLSRLACRVQSANDGTEALAALERSLPRLILMDCQMPLLDGYETTRRIRRMPLARQPHIVALTAHAMQGERERCLEAGMNDFLPKPISLAELSRVISETPR